MPAKPPKKLLIAAMPSSGSDWFASCILKSSDQLVSHPTAKEPLNPICNLQHFDALASVFGCEAEPAIDRIAASPTQKQVDEALAIALPPEVNFIKEVWVGYQLPQLLPHFHVVTFMRNYTNTFPPSRIRVYSWYLALARSIEKNRNQQLPAPMLARVTEAFKRYRWQLLEYQPTLSWETLLNCNQSQLVVELARVHLDDYLDCQLLADTIIATRTARAS